MKKKNLLKRKRIEVIKEIFFQWIGEEREDRIYLGLAYLQILILLNYVVWIHCGIIKYFTIN